MSTIPDDDGLLPEEHAPDVILDGEVVTGPGVNEPPRVPEPVDSWSDVDPSYREFADLAEDTDLAEPEELTTEELQADPEGGDGLAGPRPVAYELEGRNVDLEEPWRLLATSDYDGPQLEAAVGDLEPGARYEFRVRVVYEDGRKGDYSAPTPLTLPRDLTPPPSPTGFSVHQMLGRVTGAWDGTLSDTRPDDFSHVNLWVQQLHPPGDPDGPIGSPRLVGRLVDAGELVFGTVVDNVPHRAWLTAVDTSGNESGRSEQHEFTPTPPVDREAIQEQVDQAVERTGAELDQRLTAGLTDLYASLDEREEDVIERAKRESAERAQLEYDRLRQLTENAFAEASPNILEDPSFETSVWDDAMAGGIAEGETGSTDPTMISRESGRSRTGDYSLVFGPGMVTARLVAGTSVQAGQIWRLSAWVSRDSGSSEGYGILSVQDISGGLQMFETANLFDVPSDGEWHRVIIDAEIPSGVEAIDVVLFWFSSDSSLIAIDDMRLGNATSDLREIWDARRAAQEAHAQAGSAEQTAQTALDRATSAQSAADAVPRIFSSTAAPSGTAPAGSVWYRWSSTGANRRLVGVWTREGSSWVSMGTLEPTLIPLIDIGQGTAGQLDVDRINGLAAQFRRLHVGGGDNLFPIEAIEDFRDHRGQSPDWFFQGNGHEAWTTLSDQGGMELVIRRNDSTHGGDPSRLYYRPNGEGIHTQEGEQFRLAFYGWQATTGEVSGARNWVRAYFRDRHGGYVAFGGITYFESGWNNYTHDITVPEGAERMDILFQSESGAPRGHWGNFDLRRKNDGSLTVDGSVGARALDVEDLAADVGRMQTLYGGLASFLEGRFDQLFANDFQSRTIRGAHIEGANVEGSRFATRPSNSVVSELTSGRKVWWETRVTPEGVEEVERSGQASHLSFYVGDRERAPGIFRAVDKLVVSGGQYVEPVGYEGSYLGEVAISGSRLISPRTDAGHTFADSLRVTDDGLVGVAERLELSGWHTNRTVGEVPHAVRLGRQVIVGGSIGMQNPGNPPLAQRDPWGATWRYVRGFPPPDVPRRFQIPIITGAGNIHRHLTFEIDITGTGRFIGADAMAYRNSYAAHLDGISYMTSVEEAGQSANRNRIPDPNFMHLADPEMYYTPGAWANSSGSQINSAGGGHIWTRTNGNNGVPQLTVENRSSGTYRIALRLRRGEGIEVRQGQRVSVFLRYWNPNDAGFWFRLFFFDAANGNPLTGNQSRWNHRLSRHSSQGGYEWSWSDVADLGGSGRYYMVPTFHVQPTSAGQNYNVRSFQVTVGEDTDLRELSILPGQAEFLQEYGLTRADWRIENTADHGDTLYIPQGAGEFRIAADISALNLRGGDRVRITGNPSSGGSNVNQGVIQLAEGFEVGAGNFANVVDLSSIGGSNNAFDVEYQIPLSWGEVPWLRFHRGSNGASNPLRHRSVTVHKLS